MRVQVPGLYFCFAAQSWLMKRFGLWRSAGAIMTVGHLDRENSAVGQ